MQPNEDEKIIDVFNAPTKRIGLNEFERYLNEQEDKIKTGKLRKEINKKIETFQESDMSKENIIASLMLAYAKMPEHSPLRLLLEMRTLGASYEEVIYMMGIKGVKDKSPLEVVKLMESEAKCRLQDVLSGEKGNQKIITSG